MTRTNIIENPTQTPGEILVVFADGTGKLVNVLVCDLALATQLANTPALIANPDRAPVEDAVYAAAEAQLANA